MQMKAAISLEDQDVSDLCVLVVEDDEIMRLSLEDRLRLEQIPARAVGDLAGAHKQLETGEVDLVVTDIRLPDGSGADLFEEATCPMRSPWSRREQWTT